MTLVSLFAGIGGFDLGFERAGIRTVATVEIDANCRKLLGEKWPDAVHLGDVRTAGFADSVRYRMLGNAVCVNVAEWIAGRLAAAGADPRDQADKGERQ